MGSPATADEADDSYRTLGVGRSLPVPPHQAAIFWPCGRKGRAGLVTRGPNEEHCLRAALTDYGFTTSLFVASIQRAWGNGTHRFNEQEICS
jgi:hypothetical protein